MKKIMRTCLIVIFSCAVIFSSCEQKEKPLTSSVLTNAESSVIAPQEESSEPSSSQASTSSKNETSSQAETSSAIETSSESSSRKNTTPTVDRTSSVKSSSEQKKVNAPKYVFGNIKLASEDQTIFQTTTKVYSYEELDKIVSSSYTDITIINKEYPIEHIRETIIGYRVVYVGEEYLAVLFFDSNGSKNMAYRLPKPEGYKADFEKLSTNDKLSKVQEISPDGFYSSYSSSWNEKYEFSEHFTKDGYYIEIYYDREANTKYKDCTITKMTVELI